MQKNNQFIGFTLAEVLITLGIIGVVAAITIPVLMNNVQEQQFKEAYKKAYSAASQAWIMANNDNKLVVCNLPDYSSGGTCNNDNFKAMKSEMKLAKDCSNNNTNECWNRTQGELLWGTNPTQGALSFVTADGVQWAKAWETPDHMVLIDTNGNKPPNQYGKDRMIISPVYFTTDYSSLGFKSNVPYVYLYPDFPNADTSVYSSGAQLDRCPSMATHPCYYNSWITGGH